MSDPAAPDWPREELAAWLAESGRALEELEPLPGDVSPRRYARVVLSATGRAVAAHYPAELRDDCGRFLRTTGVLEGAGVRVPEILEADCDRGWMLVEDVGPRTLFDLQGHPLADRLPSFERAVDAAGRISSLPASSVDGINPPLDDVLLWRELRQTLDLFLKPQGLVADGLEELLEGICGSLGAEDPRPCHRDLMARNLVPTSNGELAVLDHQDLRLGPPSYDLASLLNDSFFPPAAVEEHLLEGLLTTAEARLGYHRAAVQRTLKAIGTFAAFAARGFDRHLGLIPPTLSRALLHLGHLPEAADLRSDLKELWTPVLAGAPRDPVGPPAEP